MKKILFLAVLTFTALEFVAQSSIPDSPLQLENSETSVQTCTDTCPWDFDGDGFVNYDNDLLQFLGTYGVYHNEGCEQGDFNEDNVVDIQDFRLFLPRLGRVCPQ